MQCFFLAPAGQSAETGSQYGQAFLAFRASHIDASFYAADATKLATQ
jgi:hypothetical protein